MTHKKSRILLPEQKPNVSFLISKDIFNRKVQQEVKKNLANTLHKKVLLLNQTFGPFIVVFYDSMVIDNQGPTVMFLTLLELTVASD